MTNRTPGYSGPLTIMACAGAFGAFVSLAGCANHPIDCSAGIYHSDCLPGTAGYRTALTAWHNPNIAPEAVDSRRTIDNGECTAYAPQTVSLPVPHPAAPIPVARPPSQYNVSGSINGVPYNGTVTQQSSYDPAQSMREGQEFAASLEQNSRDAADYAAAVRARNQLTDACMLKRGWMSANAAQVNN